MDISRERLQQLLDYDPDTGEFRWIRPTTNSIKIGSIAGSIHPSGHRLIKIDGNRYYSHRLAWLYLYGEWPDDMIDHINGDKDDNRMSNIRAATSRENQQNRHTHRNGRLVGCYYSNRKGRWKAQIGVTGKRKNLGYYSTEQEAHEAYLKALEMI